MNAVRLCFRLVLPLLGLLASLHGQALAALSLADDQDAAIGHFVEYLQEADVPIALTDAEAAQRAGKFTSGQNPVLNFGIGAKPVWIHVALTNPGTAPILKRLAIETAWLDKVDVYFQYHSNIQAVYRLGDSLPFMQRPVSDRFFVLDHAFLPGESHLYLRVETADPMVVPIYLMQPSTYQIRQTKQTFSYGVMYGFLLALMAYNAVLFASLRSSRYLLYALYLAMFVVMNIAYTGHGFAWLWPESVNWQRWSNPILMFLYGASGLLFAIRFLNLRSSYPRLQRAVLIYCAAFGLLLGVAIALGSQKIVLLVAFSFIFLFSGVMLLLGTVSLRAGEQPAKYFLIAALSAMLGATLTTLSTWGFIPHNSWSFRAVEIGMLIDATLLALALAYQLRMIQEGRLNAERLAQLDPLTGLNNRRAFYDKTRLLWKNAQRHAHDTSVMLLDLDRFKQINDVLGHAHGDDVLRAMADTLNSSIREGDVLARWGGEEFIVFLPETDLSAASVLAERLRVGIARKRIPHKAGETLVTASFGVAQAAPELLTSGQVTLDSLVATADKQLYLAKQQGRNQVSTAPLEII